MSAIPGNIGGGGAISGFTPDTTPAGKAFGGKRKKRRDRMNKRVKAVKNKIKSGY